MIKKLSQKALDNNRIVVTMTKLFDVVEMAVAVGEIKMGFSHAKIIGDTLYWKTEDDDGYIALDGLNRVICQVDSNFIEIKEKTQIDLDFFVVLTQTLLDCLVQSSTGVNDALPRIGRAVRSRLYAVHNLFPVQMKRYQGYPLSEVNFFLDNHLMLVAQKAINAGNRILKLKQSKIVNGRLFLYLAEEDEYLVLYPDGHRLGQVSIFRSKTLNVNDCVAEGPGTILQEDSKRKFAKEIGSWLVEAGL